MQEQEADTYRDRCRTKRKRGQKRASHQVPSRLQKSPQGVSPYRCPIFASPKVYVSEPVTDLIASFLCLPHTYTNTFAKPAQLAIQESAQRYPIQVELSRHSTTLFTDRYGKPIDITSSHYPPQVRAGQYVHFLFPIKSWPKTGRGG